MVAVEGDNAGTTVGGTELLDSSCAAGSGAEQVLSFTVPGNPGDDVVVDLTLSSATDQGFAVRLDCFNSTEIDCQDAQLGGTDETTSLFSTGGETFVIVVNAFTPGEEGPFNLNVVVSAAPVEEICIDLIDDEGDGLVDCADADCQGTAECAPGAGPVGSACVDNVDCAATDGDPVCYSQALTGYPGGHCSEHCEADGLGGDDCPVDTICLTDGLTNRCFDNCVPGACRQGYSCEDIVGDGSINVCLPACTADADCGVGGTCDLQTGRCQ